MAIRMSSHYFNTITTYIYIDMFLTYNTVHKYVTFLRTVTCLLCVQQTTLRRYYVHIINKLNTCYDST
jgi:hypothetical protein